jgi:uroporphyrinogen decarboxylase
MNRRSCMLPRERVGLALNHQEPDRIPIDLGGTLVSSIIRKAYIDLRKYIGLPEEEIRMLDYVQQLPYLDEKLMQRFRSDFRSAQLPAITAQGINLGEDGENYEFYNKWGAKLRMPKEGGLYFDYVEFPIKEPTEEACEQYAWPEPNPPEYYHRLGEQARFLYKNTNYAVVGGVIIGGGIFEQPARIMGLENFFTMLVSEPKVADKMMEEITDIYIEASNAYLDEVGDTIQVFTYWDDVCGQNGWLIRPEIYTRLVKPKQRRLVEAIRAKTKAKMFYHGCGAVYDLIPHLIEIGFDIINPVQVSARGMNTHRLKESYGKDIVFWGGGVDTQRILPFGTTAQVIEEVQRRIDDLAPGGGFVFDVVHNIQAFVPTENIVAAYETAFEYGWY